MFVDQITEIEKESLLKLLISIAQIDGNISIEETEFLSEYAKEYGLLANLDSTISIEDACASLESHEAKVIALQEIVKIAVVDGNYDSSEREGAIAISGMLNIPMETFLKIENWVLEGQRWVIQGEELLLEA